ncbi:MBL fold metallo-hydrolase [Histomonas meleagridis]|uniref:MBL fold metallo-hydrolase n=1 Tax=Histomonas meleagridis TaxID=135588 RepID=UPI00355AC9F5|nr:MBL fold metallo-hydrolase [Histomonas meleagridis]KAH0804328.1 MBL fold metallo-hydrolase [Histomonas meleagridis]
MEQEEEVGTPQNLPTYNKDHHGNGVFVNSPLPPFYPPARFESFKFWTDKGDVTESLPVRNPTNDFAKRDVIRVYWLAHATCLIQFNEIFIITDPMFSKYASPIPGFIRRRTPPPCDITDLPPISVILYSHDHYDHLDYSSLCKLRERFPKVKIFAPIGVSNLIEGWGFKDITAFDWRQYLVYKGIRFTCFPARHGTNRKGYDGNTKLWCSWMVNTDQVSVYFPGDTAVGPHFQEIKETMEKPIDLALMPIGPIEPYAMMRTVHLDGKDAYEMSRILGSKQHIAIHYGTFPLGMDPKRPELDILREQWTSSEDLHILKVGGYLEWNGTEFVEPAEN